MPNLRVRWAVVGFLFSVSCWAQAARDRITEPVDHNRTVSLQKNVHPRALPQYDQGAIDSSFALSHVLVTFQLSQQQQAALDQLLEDQRNPASTDYQRWLSPEEFGESFGASRGDIATLTSWLQSQRFTVDEVARGMNWISFSGTAEQIGHAFGTEIHRYQMDGEMHFANERPPTIPSAFSSLIGSIEGLNDFRLKPSRTGRIQIAPDFTSGSSHYAAPGDLASIYNLKPLQSAGFDGTGQKIVIAGQTDISLSDIRAFRSKFNLPAKDPQLVLYGRDPGISPGDQEEADLDVEWAGALASNATVIYVYSTSVITSVQYAVNQNLAPVISLSYGGCEPYNSPGLRSLAQQANAQGITWLAASGDSGAAACEGSVRSATTGLSVSYPASIPEVTAVGGTEFAEGSGSYWSSSNGAGFASALGYIPETAWNDTAARGGLSATGGGASIFYTKPQWQSGPGVPNDSARDVPDLSLTASADHDGYLFYTGGNFGIVGGTSASTPAFAGILSILNQYLVSKGAQLRPGLGNINPALYHLAQTDPGVFHDITTGSNIVPCTAGTPDCGNGALGYSASPGYDLVTGLGSVDANNLVTHWTTVSANISTTTSVTGSSLSIPNTATTQLTATVKPASGSAAPTGSVSFVAGTTALGTVALSGSGPSATASLSVSGSLLRAGANQITAKYAGNSSFSSSTGALTVTVASSLVATATTVAAAPASIAASASTTLTATIKPAAGGTAPTGTVTFSIGGTALGTAAVSASGSNGVATLSVPGSKLQAGANAITAAYAGSTSFSTSTGAVSVTVVNPQPVSTSTKLTASPASIASTGSTVLTAAVSAVSGSVTPTGTVTFSLSGTTLGTAELTGSGSSATAALTVAGSKLKIGSNTMTASYAGPSTFGASNGAVAVAVSGAVASAHVTATITPNPVYELRGGWPLTIKLTESAGTPATLTTFTINGTNCSSQIGMIFGAASIAAKGTLSSNLQFTSVPYPVTLTLGFGGVDASGQQWSQSVPVTFQGPQPATTSRK